MQFEEGATYPEGLPRREHDGHLVSEQRVRAGGDDRRRLELGHPRQHAGRHRRRADRPRRRTSARRRRASRSSPTPTATCPRATSRAASAGLIRHGQGNTLVLDRVSKEQNVKKGDIIVTQGTVDRRYPSIYPYGIPIGRVHHVGHERHRVVPHGAGDAVRALRLARRGRRTRLDEEAVNGVDGLKAAVLLFVAAILQVSIFSQVHVLGGVPDLAARDARRRRAAARLGPRRDRRLLRRPARRHGDARPARAHVARAHGRRLLDRPLRRDDRTRPRARAVHVGRRRSPCSSRSACSLVHFVLGERAPAGAVFRGLLPAIVLNLILTAPVYALVRAAAAPARPRRLRDRGPAPWLAPSRRDAPGAAAARRRRDGRRAVPRDAEARAAALAILGVVLLGVFAALFLRLWALQVLSGHEVRRPGVGELVPRRPAAGAARADPRPQRRSARDERAPRRAIQLWPADLPKIYTDALRGAEAARAGRAGAAVRDRARHQARATRRSRHAGDVRDAASDPMVTYLYEHAGAVPRRHDRPVVRPPLPVPGARRAGARLRRLDHAGAARAARQGLRPERRARPVRRRVGLRQLPPRRSPASSGSTSTRSAVRSSASQTAMLPKPGNTVRLTLDVKLQQAAEKALAYGIQLAHDDGQWAARRRRDRRARPERRLDPRDGVVADVQAVGLRRPRDDEGAREPGADARRPRRRRTIRRSNRALQATYPPGSVFKPVTALAAMQEHLVSPYAYLPCTGTYHSPNDKANQVFHNWDPNVNQQMDMPTALAYSCDTYFYQLGDMFFSPKDRGQPLQKWARMFGFGTLDRRRRRAGGAGPRADDRLAHALLQDGDRQALEAGQLDPARDRPGRPARDAAADGALLRADRERRQARDAAPADGRREPERHPRAGAGAPGAARASTSTRRRSRSSGRGCVEGTHLPFGTSYPVFGKFPVSIAGKTGHGGEGRLASPATSASRTSRGGAATARRTTRSSSSAP